MTKRVWCLTILTAVAVVSGAEAGNYGLDGYRESLASEHGPFVSLPTHLGAAIGAVVYMPISVVNGALSLIVFRENPTGVMESLVEAPGRGWYWGGIILGTPFRIVKGIIWDVPAALFRAVTDMDDTGQDYAVRPPVNKRDRKFSCRWTCRPQLSLRC